MNYSNNQEQLNPVHKSIVDIFFGSNTGEADSIAVEGMIYNQDRIYNREVDFVDGQWVALGTSATWNAFANSGMRYMEESDISGGATD